jgi:DNA-binding XRE family transcriptional regulator
MEVIYELYDRVPIDRILETSLFPWNESILRDSLEPELKGKEARYVRCNKRPHCVHIEVCKRCEDRAECDDFRRILSEDEIKELGKSFEKPKKGLKKKSKKRGPDKKPRERVLTSKSGINWRDIQRALDRGNLQKYREKRKWSMKKMAELLGLSLPSYGRLEEGCAPLVQMRITRQMEDKMVSEGNKNAR